MLRIPFAAGLMASCLVVAAVAEASPAITSGGVAMRCGPGLGHRAVARVPGGAPIEVFECSSWCRIGFAGRHGYIPAAFVMGGYTEPAPRDYYAAPGYPWSPDQPPPHVLPPAYFGRALEAADWGHRAHYRRGDGAYFEFDF